MKYAPVNPVPVPNAAVLTNEALVAALATAPDAVAIAWINALFVKLNGPV